ncbi:hypothetical protein ACFW17_28680 [Streptomyces sp. NPDC058961]
MDIADDDTTAHAAVSASGRRMGDVRGRRTHCVPDNQAPT